MATRDKPRTGRGYVPAGQGPVREPFVFWIGGDETLDIPDSPEITVHEPDGGTVMEILEPGTSIRRGLQLLIGSEQWPAIEEYLERMRFDELVGLMRDMTTHFELDRSLAAEGRSERRRRRRGR